MSREAYLDVSPYESVYPSQHYADFEAEEHVLAGATDATPLLWLAMFRPRDLRSVPVLERLLPGPVSEHTELLREAMRWLPGAVVTIEWSAGDEPHAGALASLRKALAVFDLGPDGGGSTIDDLRAATGLLLHQPPATAVRRQAPSQVRAGWRDFAGPFRCGRAVESESVVSAS
ncbi:hypothetical protein [Polymorphospora rubra]|uniref:Uncharacterized protein n=1 Tax=Polymorphospora rubra TaxID=338584 RepID=A0A810N7I1_9ACTN|nr:hypothetical protein [Polymorphospora rubra]BCJ69542.1 hypothetical protein Prubr_65630 [Polymorphospora rubra]